MYNRLVDKKYCLDFIENQLEWMEWEIRVGIYLILVLTYLIYKIYKL